MKDSIDKVCDDFAENTVGASCLVYKDGQELYSGCFGYADREAELPMRRDSIVRLFSLTKPVTATAAMILAERGLLSPDDPVSRFFPEYAHMTRQEGDRVVPCGTELKISHLLTMTSGLPYANDYDVSVRGAARLFDRVIAGNNGGTPVTTAEFAHSAAEIPLSFEPGTRWDYGISADVLGGVIEKVADMPFGEFLRASIFEPLGMDDTGFYVPAGKLGRLAALYKWSDSGLVRDGENYLGLTDLRSPPSFESGGAGLCSTIDDYSRFVRMLCGGGEFGGVRILGADTVGYMTSPKLSAAQNTLWDRLRGYNYGCLMRIMTAPDIAEVKTGAGEFGWDGWTGTYFNANTRNGIAVLFFTQITGAGTTWQATEISRIVYEHLSK
ncbi:MAG: serine hydrolase domain-containing protein [Ruminococcus sp.]|nr:serine hydrolase domain-containing protein [Ruminococcus sp.]